MLRLLVLASAFMAFTSLAHAHSYHTPKACSATAPEICAHIGSNTEPSTTDEWAFILHFMPQGVNAKLISNVSVKLWMQMGNHSHGSSPVTIQQHDDIHFEVTKAYFAMAGPWQIQITFDYNGASHELVIPVEAK